MRLRVALNREARQRPAPPRRALDDELERIEALWLARLAHASDPVQRVTRPSDVSSVQPAPRPPYADTENNRQMSDGAMSET